MRHSKHHNQLGRKKEHRAALMANLAAALLTHGRIKTTLPKAKALRPFVEKIITMAKKAKQSPERALAYRRLAVSRVRNGEAVATLFNKRADEFLNRPGGYTRIYKLGTRLGDAAEMAIIQLIPAADTGYEKKGKAQRKTAKVADAAPVQEEGVVEVAEAPVAESPASEAPVAETAAAGEPPAEAPVAEAEKKES